MPGVAVRVADDGELLIKGINVMRGYFNNAEATAAVLEDGWFHTGDLGEIDDEGFVQITGRKKEIIVTAGGKNVAPALLEDRLRAHPLISQCIVVGDQRPFIACLVTLDAEMLPTWLANTGQAADRRRRRGHTTRTCAPRSSARSTTPTRRSARRSRSASSSSSRPTSPRRAAHLTPKLSLKRAVVLKECADQVEELYR